MYQCGAFQKVCKSKCDSLCQDGKMVSECGYIYGKCAEQECMVVGQSCEETDENGHWSKQVGNHELCCNGLICNGIYEDDEDYKEDGDDLLIEAKCEECRVVGQSCKDDLGAANQGFCCDGLICKGKWKSDEFIGTNKYLVEAKCEHPEYE